MMANPASPERLSGLEAAGVGFFPVDQPLTPEVGPESAGRLAHAILQLDAAEAEQALTATYEGAEAVIADLTSGAAERPSLREVIELVDHGVDIPMPVAEATTLLRAAALPDISGEELRAALSDLPTFFRLWLPELLKLAADRVTVAEPGAASKGIYPPVNVFTPSQALVKRLWLAEGVPVEGAAVTGELLNIAIGCNEADEPVRVTIATPLRGQADGRHMVSLDISSVPDEAEQPTDGAGFSAAPAPQVRLRRLVNSGIYRESPAPPEEAATVLLAVVTNTIIAAGNYTPEDTTIIGDMDPALPAASVSGPGMRAALTELARRRVDLR